MWKKKKTTTGFRISHQAPCDPEHQRSAEAAASPALWEDRAVRASSSKGKLINKSLQEKAPLILCIGDRWKYHFEDFSSLSSLEEVFLLQGADPAALCKQLDEIAVILGNSVLKTTILLGLKTFNLTWFLFSLSVHKMIFVFSLGTFSSDHFYPVRMEPLLWARHFGRCWQQATRPASPPSGLHSYQIPTRFCKCWDRAMRGKLCYYSLAFSLNGQSWK